MNETEIPVLVEYTMQLGRQVMNTTSDGKFCESTDAVGGRKCGAGAEGADCSFTVVTGDR